MNTRKLRAALCLCALLLPPVAAASAQQPTTPPVKETPPTGGTPKPFALPRKETFALPNGLQVTMIPYGAIPKVTISAFVNAGNVNESAEQVWLADLTGDLMKEGTTTRPADRIAQDAARMGGDLNVGVGADQTTVSADVLSEYGPEAVALIADVMQHPLLPAAELPRLKNDYLRRLAVARTQPRPLAQERFRKALYANHPYGRLYPTEAMIAAYKIEDAQKFYRDNFGARRTHVYVAGQFDAAQMRKAIEGAFGAWPRGAAASENIPKPLAQRAIHLVDRPGAAQSTIILGLPVVDPSKPDYMALYVTNALLGGSFASRITSNIREAKGYTYSPNSQISIRYRDAYWAEIADVTTAVTGPSLKEIFYEVDRLQKEPPPDAELQGIKNYLAGIFVIQNSSRQGLINQLALLDLHKLPDSFLTNFVPNVLAVTPQDVQRITRDYLRPDKITVVVVGDKAKIAEQVAAFGEVSN